MKISEICKFEEGRNFKNDKYVIRFIHSGDWWKAYEWSVYLCNNLPNKNKLSLVSKHYSKLNKDLLYIGLQKKSFYKYFPQFKNVDDIFLSENDYVDINVEEFYTNHEIYTCDNLKLFFENWKFDNFKIKNDETFESENETIYNLINEIFNYDISNKTMVENTIFLSNIQIKIRNFKNKLK